MYVITKTDGPALAFATDFGSGWTREFTSALTFGSKSAAAVYAANLNEATCIENVKGF